MDNSSVIEVLGQAEFGMAGEIFRNHIRTATRNMVLDVMGQQPMNNVIYIKTTTGDQRVLTRKEISPSRFNLLLFALLSALVDEHMRKQMTF